MRHYFFPNTCAGVPKKMVPKLPIWEGDKIFFELLERDEGFFSLKLKYENDHLVETKTISY